MLVVFPRRAEYIYSIYVIFKPTVSKKLLLKWISVLKNVQAIRYTEIIIKKYNKSLNENLNVWNDSNKK